MYAVKTPSMQRAEELAQLLLEMRAVYEVHVFGSIARGRKGKDIDLIATVSNDNFQRFADYLSLEPGGGVVYDFAIDRFRAATAVLGWDEDAIRKCCQDTQLDIFLFPIDWLNRQDEVQRSFRHGEPTFTRKVAAAARRFNLITGDFDDIPARA